MRHDYVQRGPVLQRKRGFGGGRNGVQPVSRGLPARVRADEKQRELRVQHGHLRREPVLQRTNESVL